MLQSSKVLKEALLFVFVTLGLAWREISAKRCHRPTNVYGTQNVQREPKMCT